MHGAPKLLFVNQLFKKIFLLFHFTKIVNVLQQSVDFVVFTESQNQMSIKGIENYLLLLSKKNNKS
jgi:hypothetical protein